jgi:hypothetical protein
VCVHTSCVVECTPNPNLTSHTQFKLFLVLIHGLKPGLVLVRLDKKQDVLVADGAARCVASQVGVT